MAYLNIYVYYPYFLNKLACWVINSSSVIHMEGYEINRRMIILPREKRILSLGFNKKSFVIFFNSLN